MLGIEHCDRLNPSYFARGSGTVVLIRELTNRRLSDDGAVGSPYSLASSSCRNLNLRFAVKTTTFMRDRQFFLSQELEKKNTQDRPTKCASMAEKKAQLYVEKNLGSKRLGWL